MSTVARQLLPDTTIPAPQSSTETSFAEGLRITPNGVTVEAPRRTGGSSHADRASMLMLMARVESMGELAGSPIARLNTSSSYDPYTHAVDFD
jgi:hypothetical protein